MSTFKGRLKRGFKMGEAVHFDFEMREALANDLFEAELEVGPNRPYATDGAMMARQLVRIGDFEGPFTLSMIGRLSTEDYVILRQAQAAVESEGKSDAAPPSP